MKKMILIAGRSGVGKDTLAGLLEKNYGLKKIVSYTTRPKRQGEEGTHIFLTEKEAEKYTDRAAETRIGNYVYFTTRQQIEEDDVYIIDPVGIKKLAAGYPDVKFAVAYLVADQKTARRHAIERGGSDLEGGVFDKRRRDEDREFSEFETWFHHTRRRKNIWVLPVIRNDYVLTHLEAAAKRVYEAYENL